jgi:hypothetical protein
LQNTDNDELRHGDVVAVDTLACIDEQGPVIDSGASNTLGARHLAFLCMHLMDEPQTIERRADTTRVTNNT